MACVLRSQPAPKSFSTPPISGVHASLDIPTLSPVKAGIDFGWSCPSPSGLGFGASYLSYDRSKDWTPTCLARYHRAGVATVAVFEAGANNAQAGYAQGFADARHAAAELATLGAPAGQPFEMAVDCDCSGPSILSYFRGANAAAPGRVNAYGGYWQILYLWQHHAVGALNWQTYAWSGGAWLPASIAPLEQYLNANAFDYDRALAPNYAQWPYSAPKPPPSRTVCFPTPKSPACALVLARYQKRVAAEAATAAALSSVHNEILALRAKIRALRAEISPLRAREAWFKSHAASLRRKYS